jgi:hypothetical protein
VRQSASTERVHKRLPELRDGQTRIYEYPPVEGKISPIKKKEYSWNSPMKASDVEKLEGSKVSYAPAEALSQAKTDEQALPSTSAPGFQMQDLRPCKKKSSERASKLRPLCKASGSTMHSGFRY